MKQLFEHAWVNECLKVRWVMTNLGHPAEPAMLFKHLMKWSLMKVTILPLSWNYLNTESKITSETFIFALDVLQVELL